MFSLSASANAKGIGRRLDKVEPADLCATQLVNDLKININGSSSNYF